MIDGGSRLGIDIGVEPRTMSASPTNKPVYLEPTTGSGPHRSIWPP
jgi:hypothetical protein